MRDQPTPEQTPERIAEIRERVAKLKHLPWRLRRIDSGMCNGIAIGADVMPCEPFTGPPIATVGSKLAYAEFIVEAPQDVQFLLSQVDALTATLAHLTQERDEARGCPHGNNCACAIGSRHFWLEAFSAERKAKEQAEATLARVKAQRDELRNALVKVRAHTSYVNPTDELLRGLLQSIERIADAALVDPPVSSSTAQADDESRCAICGWPLKDDISKGCVRGNCSMRPFPETAYSPARAAREYGRVLDISRFKNGRPVSSSTETT